MSQLSREENHIKGAGGNTQASKSDCGVYAPHNPRVVGVIVLFLAAVHALAASMFTCSHGFNRTIVPQKRVQTSGLSDSVAVAQTLPGTLCCSPRDAVCNAACMFDKG